MSGNYQISKVHGHAKGQQGEQSELCRLANELENYQLLCVWQKPSSSRKSKTCFILDNMSTCCCTAQWFPTLFSASLVFLLVLQVRLPPLQTRTDNQLTLSILHLQYRNLSASQNFHHELKHSTWHHHPPEKGSTLAYCVDPLHVLTVTPSLTKTMVLHGKSMPVSA